MTPTEPDASPSGPDASSSGPDASSNGPDASSGAPVTQITATPPDPDNQSSVEFEFTSDQAGSTFQCKLDQGNFAACTSPHTVAVTGESAHTFEVYASNDGLDDPTPASYTWSLDQSPPTIDIQNGPATTSSTNAAFSFAAEAGAQLACRVDSNAFAACNSPTSHAVSGLGTGTHTFEVRATDSANNQATDSHSWTIEPPCNPILIEAESLTGTSWSIATGSVLHNNQALDTSTINSPFSFTFQGKGLIIYYRKGPTAGAHAVSIDGSAPVSMTATDPNGWSYQNPTTVTTGLTNALHTATVNCTVSHCQIDYFAVTCN